MKYDFYPNLSRADYDAIAAANFSRLKHLERSPMAFRYHCDNPAEPTAPMILGNACHTAILEPSLKDFAVWPGPGRRFGKAFDEWAAAHVDKIQLTRDEADHVEGMTKAVHANPVAHKYLRHGNRELSMVWRDLTFSRTFKARIDTLVETPEGSVLVSLKSTTDCREYRFSSQYHKMAYHVQDAIYQNGFFYITGELPRMVVVAVESKPPYESAVYRVSQNALRQGQADLAKWIARLTECERSNNWPPAETEEQSLELPSWAYPGGDFELDDLEPIAR